MYDFEFRKDFLFFLLAWVLKPRLTKKTKNLYGITVNTDLPIQKYFELTNPY